MENIQQQENVVACSGAVEKIEKVDDNFFQIQKDDTPTNKKLKSVLSNLKVSYAKKIKLIKCLQQRDRRNKQKINSLMHLAAEEKVITVSDLHLVSMY